MAPIDFVAFARACGAEGFRCEQPAEVGPAIQAALRSAGPAVIEAVVDPLEPPAMPGKLQTMTDGELGQVVSGSVRKFASAVACASRDRSAGSWSPFSAVSESMGTKYSCA